MAEHALAGVVRSRCALLAGAGVLLALAGAAGRPSSTSAYRVVHGWPVLPAGEMLGTVSGVGVDSHGDVFVFHRAGRLWESDVLSTTPIAKPTVVLFDGRTGRLLARWGEGLFAMPHGLTVDRHDHVWLTDVALQQVYEFSHDGRLLRTLGERGVAGDDSAHFDRPTDVAVAPDGSFYVSDGYRNSRVLKFASDGRFLFQWGSHGSGPGQFDLPHGIALDGAGRVYVADRSNARVQIFDGAGRYRTEWKSAELGRPFDIAVAPDGTVFVADGGDLSDNLPRRSGVAVVRPDGSILERFGRWGEDEGQFAVAHDIAVGGDGAVYVGDGSRVQKFVRNPK